MATDRTFRVTGRLLYNHKLYQGPGDTNPDGDTITFGPEVSDAQIQEWKELGHLGGKHAVAMQRKAAAVEEQTGLTGMSNEEEAKLWSVVTRAKEATLLAREKAEAGKPETTEGQRKANIDEVLATPSTGEQREAEILKQQTEGESEPETNDATGSSLRDAGSSLRKK